jgi:hypothetical protein
MVKVYYETENGSAAELIAVFNDENTYEACIPILESRCLKEGWDLMTESIDEDADLEEQMGD